MELFQKTASVPEKNHQANQSIDLLVQHEKNSVKNCHCATKTKKENKSECAQQKVNTTSAKSCEKLSLCNEKKEEKNTLSFSKTVDEFTNAMNKIF